MVPAPLIDLSTPMPPPPQAAAISPYLINDLPPEIPKCYCICISLTQL